MIHREKNELIMLSAAIVLAGALSGLGSYMGARSGGSIVTATAPAAQDQQGAQQPQQPQQTKENVDPVTSADHIRGSLKAKVVLVEYSDPECPFCKMYQPNIKQVVDKYSASGDVAWVYRNFPIDSLHPKARKEAEATECAAEIGGNDGFWKFYDKLFEVTPANNGLDPAQLPVIAKEVGLNVDKFNACLSSGKYASKIEASIQSGVKAGVTGTPTTFIIGKDSFEPVVGAIPAADLEAKIKSALSK
jgi:protein-disulfide isomerase